MNNRTEHSDVSAFDSLSKADAAYAARFYRDWLPRARSTQEQAIPEERRQYLSAFDANPKSAAGRRMQQYLRQHGHGTAISVLRDKQDAAGELHKNRVAFTFLVVTSGSLAFTQAAMASTALDQTIFRHEQYKSMLSSLLEKTQEDYDRLVRESLEKESAYGSAEDNVSEIERALKEARARLQEAEAQEAEAESKVVDAGLDVVALENRAIKIVRPMDSIGDLRKIITSPETEAPEIYIVAGTNDNGKIVYDKLTTDEGGNVLIEKVLESDAPELIKDAETEGVYTDMFERVYHRENEDGQMELVRMEYGMNGELMGRTGDISTDMIEQYAALTGKRLEEITPCGNEYEKRVRAQYGFIDDHAAACEIKHAHIEEYEAIQESLDSAMDEFKKFRADMIAIQKTRNMSADKIAMIKSAIKHADEIIQAGKEYKQMLHDNEFHTMDELLADMPKELKDEIEKRLGMDGVDTPASTPAAPAAAQSCEIGVKGPNPMNTAWSTATPQIPVNMNDGPAPVHKHGHFTNEFRNMGPVLH